MIVNWNQLQERFKIRKSTEQEYIDYILIGEAYTREDLVFLAHLHRVGIYTGERKNSSVKHFTVSWMYVYF